MSDFAPPDETRPAVVSNLGKDFEQAIVVGRSILKVAGERGRPANSKIKNYSTPFLDKSRFSPENIGYLSLKTEEQVGPEQVRLAKLASVSLAIEAACQVVEAQSRRSGGVVEDPQSINGLQKAINQAGGYVTMAVDRERALVIEAGRKALKKRQSTQSSDNDWNDDRVVSWVKGQFTMSSEKLSKYCKAVNNVHR